MLDIHHSAGELLFDCNVKPIMQTTIFHFLELMHEHRSEKNKIISKSDKQKKLTINNVNKSQITREKY